MPFVCFHPMPWPYLPDDFERRHESAWLTVPNTLDDPRRVHALYRDYLDQLVAPEALGFDVVGVNEHHQNAYGLMPSPTIMASALELRGVAGGDGARPLIQRTSRIKVLVLGNAPPLYDHPQRVAEELAMLDVLSAGRLIAGMVVGLGVEAFSYEVNPTFVRERYREAHDLIVRAWTEPGPFHFEGKHYVPPARIGWPCMIYVADTDAQARREFEPHFFQVGSLPHELALKNTTIFAHEVMPALRAEFP